MGEASPWQEMKEERPSGKNTGSGQAWVPTLAPLWITCAASSIGTCSEPQLPHL